MLFSLKLLAFYLAIKFGVKGTLKSTIGWGIFIAFASAVCDYLDQGLKWYQVAIDFVVAGILMTGLFLLVKQFESIWVYFLGILVGTALIFAGILWIALLVR
jgi:hypothetical protein